MVDSAEIGNITMSDHAPVWCTLSMKALELKPMRWRLDMQLWRIWSYMMKFTKKLNTIEQTSHPIIWDAFKV